MSGTDDLTPPRATKRGDYSKINDRLLLERTADGMLELRQDHRRLRNEVRLVLRPYARPWYERGAPAAIALVLILWFAWTTMHTSSAAPEPTHATQANR